MQMSPLLGHGIGGYSVNRYKVNSDPDYFELQAHNLFGQLMGDLGAVGIIGFVWLIITIVWY